MKKTKDYTDILNNEETKNIPKRIQAHVIKKLLVFSKLIN